jgi:hypothetical protein
MEAATSLNAITTFDARVPAVFSVVRLQGNQNVSTFGSIAMRMDKLLRQIVEAR